MTSPLQFLPELFLPLLAQADSAGAPAGERVAEDAGAPAPAGNAAEAGSNDAAGSGEAGSGEAGSSEVGRSETGAGSLESTTTQQVGEPKPAKAAQEPSPLASMIPLILMGLAFYMILIRPQSKERRRHDDMLKTLKKNDRVITSGGIIGTVANVSADGKEVTVKVDDNTRIRFSRGSISSILSDDTRDSKDGATQSS